MLERWLRWLVCGAVLACFGQAGMAADNAASQVASGDTTRLGRFADLPWQRGPATGRVGNRAQLTLPESSGLLPEAHGARFLELTGNLPAPGQTVLVHGDWWAVFAFVQSGYVKDDEKLDADALLKSLRDQDQADNAQRRKRGMAELTTDGWVVPPHYDATSKQLEWGLRLRASNDPEPIVNYTMRILGRHGYESVVLVTDEKSLDRDVKELRGMLTSGFRFNDGERYAEFKPGDHVAEFGLGALVLGGVGAAAVKGGWFKGMLGALAAGWKVIAIAVAALFAGIGSLFNRSPR